MRGNKRDQLMHEQRKALEQKRSAESKVRKEKRKAKGKAEEIAMAIKRSPAGKKAAGTPEGEEGDRKEERASEPPKDQNQSLGENGREKKANPGRGPEQAKGVKPPILDR